MNKLFTILKDKNITVATAESLTGGLLSSSFVDQSGASKILKGGVITYMIETKNSVLNIPFDILKEDAVNENTAELMGKNVCNKFNSDIGLSTTGIAEEYNEKKPCVYFSIYIKNEDKSYNFFQDLSNIDCDRNEIRNIIVLNVIRKLTEILSI